VLARLLHFRRRLILLVGILLAFGIWAGCARIHKLARVGSADTHRTIPYYHENIVNLIQGLDWLQRREALFLKEVMGPAPPSIRQEADRVRNSISPDEDYLKALASFHRALERRLDAAQAEKAVYMSWGLGHGPESER